MAKVDSRCFGAIRVLLTTLSIAYLLYFAHSYVSIGLHAVTWHTHFAFPLIGMTLTVVFYAFFQSTKPAPFFVWTLFSSLFLAELILSLTGVVDTYAEKNEGKYVPPSTLPDKLDYYWIDCPNTIKHLKTNEFHYLRHTNEYGYSDVHWDKKKKPTGFRVLCLGDSFTEGDGAHKDSSYVAFLRRKLRSEGCKSISVMNAGKCGSDPFFNYVNLRDRLSHFKPDLIIQTVSSHDITDDITLRGGMERFDKDTTVSFVGKRLGSSAQLVYASSRFSRIFFHILGYNELLVHPESRENGYQKELEKTVSLFEKYTQLADSIDADVMFVLLPDRHEVRTDYPVFMKKLKQTLSKSHYNLTDLRSDYVQYKHTLWEYYWVEDAHHNALGYELMANSIYPEVVSIIQRNKPELCEELN